MFAAPSSRAAPGAGATSSSMAVAIAVYDGPVGCRAA